MTDDRMALAEMLEKACDGDLLREMIAFMAQRLMEADVQWLVGAGPGERSETRENWRNGCRDRFWHTRAGTVPLKIPKLRSGSYFPGFLEHVKRALRDRYVPDLGRAGRLDDAGIGDRLLQPRAAGLAPVAQRPFEDSGGRAADARDAAWLAASGART